MGFMTGRISALRFRVLGDKPRLFTEEHLDRLTQFKADRFRIPSADGVAVGWAAGEHVLDTDFTPGKNVCNDLLLFDLRVDVDKLPADKLKAYTAVELKAISRENPSGNPSARQKKEAREAAREQLEEEARDGRFKKSKCIQAAWDAVANEVWFGATGLTHLDRFQSLFHRTFGLAMEAVTAAVRFGERAEGLSPTPFVPGVTPAEIAWIPGDTPDWLGNEFLLWLWYMSDAGEDTIKVADFSEVTFMLARSLDLECPNGQTGQEAIRHEGPSRLPEAKRAAQSGKLPRKAGLTVVHRGEQYELTLHAETLAVGAVKLPSLPEDVTEVHARRQERVSQARGFFETLDALYAEFAARRADPKWALEVTPRMQQWLARRGG